MLQHLWLLYVYVRFFLYASDWIKQDLPEQPQRQSFTSKAETQTSDSRSLQPITWFFWKSDFQWLMHCLSLSHVSCQLLKSNKFTHTYGFLFLRKKEALLSALLLSSGYYDRYQKWNPLPVIANGKVLITFTVPGLLFREHKPGTRSSPGKSHIPLLTLGNRASAYPGRPWPMLLKCLRHAPWLLLTVMYC